MDAITNFSGEHAFLSNFFRQQMHINSLMLPTLEHAFQAFKTTDIGLRYQISQIKTPGEAKRFGRNLELRNDWEEIKLEVMERLINIKFNIPYLSRRLIATEDAILIEGNTWGG